MTGLIGGGKVEMDYEEGVFYRTFLPTASHLSSQTTSNIFA